MLTLLYHMAQIIIVFSIDVYTPFFFFEKWCLLTSSSIIIITDYWQYKKSLAYRLTENLVSRFLIFRHTHGYVLLAYNHALIGHYNYSKIDSVFLALRFLNIKIMKVGAKYFQTNLEFMMATLNKYSFEYHSPFSFSRYRRWWQKLKNIM